MIYRNWSLLTMPAVVTGAIVATVVVANFIFVENDPLRSLFKGKPKKQDGGVSSIE